MTMGASKPHNMGGPSTWMKSESSYPKLHETTLFWDKTGPLLRFTRYLNTATFDDGTLHIEDLNPQMEKRWSMSRWELAKLGFRALYAAWRW